MIRFAKPVCELALLLVPGHGHACSHYHVAKGFKKDQVIGVTFHSWAFDLCKSAAFLGLEQSWEWTHADTPRRATRSLGAVGTPVVCDLGLWEAAGSDPAVPMLLMGCAGQVATLLLSRVENFKCLE